MRIGHPTIVALLLATSPLTSGFGVPNSISGTATFSSNNNVFVRNVDSALKMDPMAGVGTPTELPDSLEDSALIAANACQLYAQNVGSPSRCRIDFDTSVGDETFSTMKSSTEYMQKFVSALSYAMMPGLMQKRQMEMMNVVNARAELQNLMMEGGGSEGDAEFEQRKDDLMSIISSGGKDPNQNLDSTIEPVVRIYFPDEGSAALARRDWTQIDPNTNEALVPSCVQFSSLGGVQMDDTSNDYLIFFFCPKASESDDVEEILYKCEAQCPNLMLSIFVNPLLVDMGVTGFGMAGRLLRERLIDPLVNVYYLRTLQWGALTRVYPNEFTVWQEDEYAESGYRLIKTLDTLPSNPEVEDIYDIENGNMKENKEGFGLLNAIGDFVNGMTQL